MNSDKERKRKIEDLLTLCGGRRGDAIDTLEDRLRSHDEKYLVFFEPWARNVAIAAFNRYAPDRARASRPSTRLPRPDPAEGDESEQAGGSNLEARGHQPPTALPKTSAEAGRKELVTLMGMAETNVPDWMKHRLTDGSLLSRANPIKLRHEANHLRIISRETAKNAAIYKALAEKIEQEGAETVADVADHAVIGQIEYMIEQRLREPLTIEHKP